MPNMSLFMYTIRCNMNIVSIWRFVMFDRLWTAFPLVAGAFILFAAFCAILIVLERKEEKKNADSSHSVFSYKKKSPVLKRTSPARSYPNRSYNLRADGFCEKASRRTAV